MAWLRYIVRVHGVDEYDGSDVPKTGIAPWAESWEFDEWIESRWDDEFGYVVMEWPDEAVKEYMVLKYIRESGYSRHRATQFVERLIDDPNGIDGRVRRVARTMRKWKRNWGDLTARDRMSFRRYQGDFQKAAKTHGLEWA